MLIIYFVSFAWQVDKEMTEMGRCGRKKLERLIWIHMNSWIQEFVDQAGRFLDSAQDLWRGRQQVAASCYFFFRTVKNLKHVQPAGSLPQATLYQRRTELKNDLKKSNFERPWCRDYCFDAHGSCRFWVPGISFANGVIMLKSLCAGRLEVLERSSFDEALSFFRCFNLSWLRSVWLSLHLFVQKLELCRFLSEKTFRNTALEKERLCSHLSSTNLSSKRCDPSLEQMLASGKRSNLDDICKFWLCLLIFATLESQ